MGKKWWKFAREPLASDHPVMRGIKPRSGEIVYQGLGVMDWQQYLAEIWESGA
jgi:hypothetical protein